MSSADSHRRLEALLQELAKEPGLLGAALVSRDGLAVQAAGSLALARETFSAMSATFMGAAEIALSELGDGKMRSIVASTDRMKLITIGATRDLLLVACAASDTSAETLLPRLEAAAKNVAHIVSGG
jgi:predicted regulator of Ras-like GTPase activity (Roadblock/LC7/MglB family)